MKSIDQIRHVIPGIKLPAKISHDQKTGSGISFSSFLGEVNAAQKAAGEKIIGVVSGEVEDLHDAMIAVEKAGLSFQILLEFRNKLMETYQEIMRMRF
ncbi:MAG: flagellar hook-basal body complex protein FliE [Candidatus Marinimicrobia bacterium]|nr:flagellar hook-basal body complex protein FliE [Candidatus Neomarinimicrobiota bacterium]MCH7886857.1 flagellar hook-basal body complex protein FliE [Candidatus Neomarinimicrobiota bacterium]MCH8287981.1 flagellar hook-basal body complex protein FliE [Candidatus Neomarinimicrobiota bacterium]